MKELRVYLFGDLWAVLDGQHLEGRLGSRAAELLAYLALWPDRPHSREKLADAFWPESDAERGRASLRRALYLLRRALGQSTHDHLEISETAICLRSEGVWTDAGHFERALVNRGGELDAERARTMESALEEYSGDLLTGCYSDWPVVERERLRQMALVGWNQVGAWHLARGHLGQAQKAFQSAVDIDPADEEAHQALMTIYARLGQRSAALQQYDTCRRMLERELAVEPAASTVALYERILDSPPNAPPGIRADGQAVGPADELVQARSRPRLAAIRLAAGAGLVLLGGLWAAASPEQVDSPDTTTLRQLVNEHRLASLPGRSMPVVSGQADTVGIWFAGQVPFDVRVPEKLPGGFRLEGGGICDLSGDLAAAVFYTDDRGRRLTVFEFGLEDLALPSTGVLGDNRYVAAALGQFSRDRYSAVYWSRDGLGYAVVAELREDELAAVAGALQAQ